MCADVVSGACRPKPLGRGWRSLPTRLWRDRRAATAIEFAFAAPVALSMILGVIEFGWAFHCGASIRAAVTRESRQLIANPAMSVDAFQTAVKSDLAGMADPNVTFAFSTEAFGSGSATRVSWTYQHPILYPFIPAVTLNFNSSVLVPQ